MRRIINFLQSLPTRLKGDLAVAEQRQAALQRAVKAYLRLATPEKLSSGEAYEPLEKLAQRFEENSLDPIEIYKRAFEANPDDLRLLKIIIRDVIKNGKRDKESINYLRLIVERVEEKFPYLKALAECHQAREQPYQLMLTYEKIVDTYYSYSQLAAEEKGQLEIDWQEAEAAYRDASNNLIDLYLKFGRKDDKALSLLMKAFENDPERVDILELMAQAYSDRKRLDEEALHTYECYLAYDPDNRDLRLLLSRGYLESGRAPEAISLLEEYYKRNPADTVILSKIIDYYQASAGINPKSISYFIELARRRPEDQDLTAKVAHYFAQLASLTEEAIEFYQKALALSPGEDKFALLLSKCCYQSQDYLRAAEYLEQLYRKGRTDKEVIVPLAHIYVEFDRSDAEAMHVYERVSQLGIKIERMTEFMSRNYFQARRTDAQAIKCYSQVLEANPDNIEARKGRCLYYRREKDFAALIPEAIKLLTRIPTDQEGIDYLATAITMIFDKSIAQQMEILDLAVQRQVLEQAFLAQPENQHIAQSLSQLYMKTGYSGPLAEKVLGYAYQLEPNSLLLLNALVHLHYKQGDKDKPLIYGKRAYQLLKKKQRWNDQEKEIFDGLCLVLAKIYLQARFPLKVFSAEEQESILAHALTLGIKEPKLTIELAERAARRKDCSPDALELYQRAIDIEPHRKGLRAQFLNTCFALKQPERVVNFCAEELQRNPEDKEALRLLIDCLDRFDYSSLPLISRLEELYAQFPANEQICLALALAYSNQALYDINVLKILERATRTETMNTKLFRALADCYVALAEFDKAKFTYQRLLWVLPEDETIRLKLTDCFQRSGEISPEAKKSVEYALRLKPKDLQLHIYHLKLLKGLGEKEELVRFFCALLEAFPEQISEVLQAHFAILEDVVLPPELALKIARWYIKADKFSQALKELGRLGAEYTKYYTEILDCYNQLLAKDPINIMALAERGILYKLTENYEEAMADLEKAHTLDADNENIVYELAEAYNGYLKQQDYKDLPALHKLGEFYWQLEEYDQCIAIYQKLLAQEKESAEALLHLARAFHKKGALEMALQYYKRLPKDSKLLQYFEELADAFYAAGKVRSAIDTLNEIVSYDISYHDAVEKLAELQEEVYGQAEREGLFGGIMSQLGQGARERFELLEEIGRGAWSIVFKAYDKEIDEIVALKILPEKFSEYQEAVERLKNELKATRKLVHPGIVRLYDIGEEKGRKYLSMEYIDGGDLKKLMAGKERLELEAFFYLTIQIADALGYAHSQHVLHLDIKPANVLLTQKREIKLTDFGIAGVLAQAQQTTTDIIVGTPLYMSPEQAEGKACSIASDIYSLGVVMYEMLAGAPPFTVGNITYHHIFTQPREIQGITYSLQRLIMKCLEKTPQHRYSSFEELKDDLLKIQNALAGR